MKIGRETRQAAKSLFRACCVEGQLDGARVREAVRRLIAEKPRQYVPILSRLQKLVAFDQARRHARVETAVPVAPAVREALVSALRKRGGAEAGAEFVTRPELIGGMRIQLGSDVWDTSVAGRLEELKSRL